MGSLEDTDLYLLDRYPNWKRVLGVKKYQKPVYRTTRTIAHGLEDLNYTATVFWKNNPVPGWYWRLEETSGKTFKMAKMRASHFDPVIAIEHADIELSLIASTFRELQHVY